MSLVEDALNHFWERKKSTGGEWELHCPPPPSDPFDRAVVDPLHVSLFIYIHVSTYSVRERTERCYGRQQKALAVDKR